MDGLARDARYAANNRLEVTHVPDGYVIYDEEQGRVHYLNPTAAIIYEVCDGSKTVDDIRAFVRDAYGLGEEPSLEEFFQSLESSGLVCRVD
jgi:hypothetical protein